MVKAVQQLESGVDAETIAREYGISRATLYTQGRQQQMPSDTCTPARPQPPLAEIRSGVGNRHR